MEENESIEKMNIRFQAITSKLEEHNIKLSNKELVSKLLRSLPLYWNEISNTIEETENINSMSPESLIDLLRVHELALKDIQELKGEEAEVARKGKQALEHEDLVEEPDEEYLERFSRKIQKWYNFKKNGGKLAKGMTTWDVLDNFSEDESEIAPGAEGSSSEDGSDSEDSSSYGDSEPENIDNIKRRMNQVYSHLSKAKLIKHLEKALLKSFNSQQKYKTLKADYENLSKLKV